MEIPGNRKDQPAWLWALVFSLGYLVAAQAGMLLASETNMLLSVWLPAGLLLGTLIKSPMRRWWQILSLSLVCSLVFNFIHGRAMLAGLGFGFANGVEALVGALLIRRIMGVSGAVDSLGKLIGSLVAGVLVGPAIAGLLVVAMLRFFHVQADPGSAWLIWCSSSGGGIVMLAPLIIAWGGKRGSWSVPISAARVLEVVALSLGLLASGYLGFNDYWRAGLARECLPLPFLLWAAMRFGPRGITLASLCSGLFAGYLVGRSPLPPTGTLQGPYGGMFEFQIVLTMGVVAGLVVAMMMDIVRNAEARQGAMIAGISDVIAVVDRNGIITYKSSNIERFFGWRPSELIGKPVHITVHPDDRAMLMENYERLLQLPGASVQLTYRYRCRDGSYLPIELTAVNQLENPHIAGILANYHDISRRKSAEDALRESEARYRIITDNMEDVVWVLDPQTQRFLFMSPSVYRLRGYTAEEIMRQGLEDVVLPADLPGLKTLLRKQLEPVLAGRPLPERPVRMEVQQPCKDGSTVWVEIICNFVRNTQNGQLELHGVSRGISDRKRTEEELRQAQKLEAVGRLAGGVAHDFNNILAAMMLNLGLLRHEPRLPADFKQSLAELETDAKRAAELTKQLLLFGRRQVFSPKPVELGTVLESMQRMLRRTLGEHIQIHLKRPEGELWVQGDAGMLDQVLMNLSINARDAMPEGGLLLLQLESLRLESGEPEKPVELPAGDYACLRVRDTGVGMSEEVRRHVFEPFFTTKPIGKGTGLGLATVYSIIQQHKGWVRIDSSPGAGTEFRAYLPLIPAPVAVSVASAAQTVPVGGRERILVVEDEDAVRRGLMLRLSRLGYEVVEAASGPRALEVWRRLEGAVDLLFTDMMMPEGMTGLELAHRLREEKPGLRVIISSGYSPELSNTAELYRSGISFLAKPYTGEALAELIRDELDETTIGS
jgi:PAS domain S-box-containing protein